MSRPPKTIRSVYFNIGLPEDLAARVKLSLYSQVEERVPHGAQQAFFVNLVKEHFDAIDHKQQQKAGTHRDSSE